MLKIAGPKLRKTIVSNCNRDLLPSISECVLNLLHGNIRVSDCAKRKLKKFKSSLRSLVDRRLPFASMNRVIIQRGGFLLPLLSAVLPTQASLLFQPATGNKKLMTLRKMFLVPAADYDASSLHSQPPPLVKTRRVAKRRKTASQHPHDKWIALLTKLLEPILKKQN